VEIRGEAGSDPDMTTWDDTVDVVIVGSGGGGMVAALTAADAGASVLVLEKQDRVGGSTAMSGGIVWVPDNPVMQRVGVPDSYEDAMVHFEAVVGDVGPASSYARRDAFLTAGPEMVRFLQERGVRFTYCRGYSDYYSNAKGGHDLGRGIEPVPFDARVLGDWHQRLQPGLAQSLGLAVMTNEARSLAHYNRSIRAFAVSARVVLRTSAARLRRQVLLTNGASLIAQMLQWALAQGIPLWTDTPLEDLVVEDERVVGVRAVRDGSPVHIAARRGVLLASGGFAHNPEMREQYGGDQPNRARWSIANPGDTGEVLQAAMRLGARTDLMDEAWWLPSPRTGRFGQSTLDQARQRPRTIYVDAAGKRFVNESNSYMEVGKEMYARDKTSRAVPCWLGRSRTCPSCAASTPRACQKRWSDSTGTRPKARTPTTGAASRHTTVRWATRTTRCTRASARSTNRRTTVSRSCPATSAPVAASSPTSTRGCSARTTGRSPACTRRATAPPP